MNCSVLRPFFASLTALTLLALVSGCVDTLPTAAETAAYDTQAGALTAPAKPLPYGAAISQTAKTNQALQWTWAAPANGTFVVKVSNWKKAPMLAKLQRLVMGGAWQNLQTKACTGSCELGVTPSSAGAYRLDLSGASSGLSVTAALTCQKGACLAPVAATTSCPATPQLAATAAKQGVTKNVLPWAKGLLWMSESDYPFDAVGLPSTAKGAPTSAELIAALGLPATTPSEVWPTDKLYSGLVAQGKDAGLVKAIRSAVEAQGTGFTVIRVGTIQVQIYVVGRSSCGALVGLHTVSIET
jgi:hypothetical protein